METTGTARSPAFPRVSDAIHASNGYDACGLCLRVQWFELRDNEYRYKGGYWQAKAAKAFPIVDLF